jgi:D-arabinose 1-dehydrogenase-like Zn-dependent alcohol dehydrogenase
MSNNVSAAPMSPIDGFTFEVCRYVIPRSHPDSKATNVAKALQQMGGAQVILATAPSSKAMSDFIDGLAPNGRLMVVGAAPGPIEVAPSQLIFGSRTIQG